MTHKWRKLTIAAVEKTSALARSLAEADAERDNQQNNQDVLHLETQEYSLECALRMLRCKPL